MRSLFTHLDCADSNGLPFHEANMKRQFFCDNRMFVEYIFYYRINLVWKVYLKYILLCERRYENEKKIAAGLCSAGICTGVDVWHTDDVYIAGSCRHME